MKRITIVMLLINTAVLVFAQNTRAFIQEMSGTVELQTQGSTAWTPARLNETIRESTIISTGFRSTAVIAVGNTTLLVQPLTRISLEALANREQTETVNLNLNSGRLRIDVKPPAGGQTNVSVQSPSTTASVRGTVFDLDTVSIRVQEGSVSFRSNSSNGNSVMVNTGQESWIDASGSVVNPLIAVRTNIPLPPLPGQESRTRARQQAPESGTIDESGAIDDGNIHIIPK